MSTMPTIAPRTVAWIILKAREFDGKDEDTIGESDGDYDDNPLAVLEDRPGDATEDELRSWIEDLNDTEQAELVAIYWIGRGDGDAKEFDDLVAQARRARTTPTADYLLGSPMLGDMLEEGLEALGIDTTQIESEAI